MRLDGWGMDGPGITWMLLSGLLSVLTAEGVEECPAGDWFMRNAGVCLSLREHLFVWKMHHIMHLRSGFIWSTVPQISNMQFATATWMHLGLGTEESR